MERRSPAAAFSRKRNLTLDRIEAALAEVA